MKIGELCRAMIISDVASLINLDWHAVKDLDKPIWFGGEGRKESDLALSSVMTR